MPSLGPYVLQESFTYRRQAAVRKERSDINGPREASKLYTKKKEPGPAEQLKMVFETISKIIKIQLPAYLKRLPLPETIGGFARLTGNSQQQLYK